MLNESLQHILSQGIGNNEYLDTGFSYNTIAESESTLFLGADRFWIVFSPPFVILAGLFSIMCLWDRISKYIKDRHTSVGIIDQIPYHVAVIMDGNRRFGKEKYGVGTRGHFDGSKKLVQFVEWCQAFGIKALTAFAFSTENWNRDASEVQALMQIFEDFLHRISKEGIKKDIRIRVLVSNGSKLPKHILQAIEEIETSTSKCSGFYLSLCVSYGGRDEIVRACRAISEDVKLGKCNIDNIDEKMFSDKLLTRNLPDPDILIRTSGEYRISNFLLYQLAYSEFFFVKKYWPELTEQDLYHILMRYSKRKRRFGK